MTTVRMTEKAEAIKRLREWLAPGDTVHTILRHVSRSGMLRVIQLVTLPPHRDTLPADDRLYWIGYNAALAMGDIYSDKEGIRVSGAGMDMGFHLVYNLARTLWPDGFDCAGERCPSSDHTNGQPRYDFMEAAHQSLTGGTVPERPHHNDGGYALRQAWL